MAGWRVGSAGRTMVEVVAKVVVPYAMLGLREAAIRMAYGRGVGLVPNGGGLEGEAVAELEGELAGCSEV